MSVEYLDSLVRKAIAEGKPWEGSGDAAELAYLAKLAKKPGVKIIGEIGFNAGFSSYTFLRANPAAIVYSFDLVEFDYTLPAKQYIDTEFPGRHILIRGNSLETVLQFHEDHPGVTFDLAFVDGGHDYEVAKADLVNMRVLSTKDTILVTDDLTPWKPWGEGPTRAWQEALSEGLVIQEELVRDGKIVSTIEPPGERSWVVGKYR